MAAAQRIGRTRFAATLQPLTLLAQAVDLGRKIGDIGRQLGDARLQIGVLALEVVGSRCKGHRRVAPKSLSASGTTAAARTNSAESRNIQGSNGDGGALGVIFTYLA